MQPELLIISPDSALRELAIRESSAFPFRVREFSTAQSARQHVAEVRRRQDSSTQPAARILLVDSRTEDIEQLREYRQTDLQGSRYCFMRGCADDASPSRISWASGGCSETYVARPDDGAAMRHLLERLTAANAETPQAEDPVSGLEDLIGRSVAFRVGLEKAMRAAADRDAPVLLCGEPGTGKRLFARAIHAESARASKPLVEIDCRKVRAGESDLTMLALHGSSEGAQSGRSCRKSHMVEESGLLLSHVDALDRADQQRLLAYLDAHKLWRIQQLCRPRHDLRVIATSEQDLDRDTRMRGFNAELYERLAPQRIDLPALRERPSDALLLAEYFLNGWTRCQGRPAMRLARPARERLLGHGWPGNVAELRSVMRTALERAGDAWEIRVEHLDGLFSPAKATSRSGAIPGPRAMRSALRASAPRAMAVRDGGQPHGELAASARSDSSGPRPVTASAESGASHSASQQAFIGGEGQEIIVQLPDDGIGFDELEKAVLLAALERTSGNVVQAAKLLRMGRGSLRYRLEKHHLVEPKRRSSRGGSRRQEPEEFEAGLRRAS